MPSQTKTMYFSDLNLIVGSITQSSGGDVTVSDDLTVTDDLIVSGLATVAETLGVTGVVTAPSLTISGTTNVLSLSKYVATVTVANGATTGKEAAIAMPANFLPICVAVHVTTASTNACALVDIGDDADTDSYCDGLASTVGTTTGFKGLFGCNGVRSAGAGITGTSGATTTADEVEIVVSADPGATGITYRLTFL